MSIASAIGDAIKIGGEVMRIGTTVYRTVRQKRRHHGITKPVRIPDIDAEIERRARQRRELIDRLYPEN
ncbi:MAG: hypothetical protein ACOC9O_04320 [Myxococcota bacterium]